MKSCFVTLILAAVVALLIFGTAGALLNGGLGDWTTSGAQAARCIGQSEFGEVMDNCLDN